MSWKWTTSSGSRKSPGGDGVAVDGLARHREAPGGEVVAVEAVDRARERDGGAGVQLGYAAAPTSRAAASTSSFMTTT